MIYESELPDLETLRQQAGATRRKIRTLNLSLQLLPGQGYLRDKVEDDLAVARFRLDEIGRGLALLSELTASREMSGSVTTGLRS